MRRRVALKIAYIGTNFHGYQRQPGFRTVEGELLKVFKDTEIIEDTWDAHYSVAGRTDKGVHSISNVISFITTKEIRLNYINGLLPDDIRIISEARVPFSFRVRFPQTRTYTYIQPLNPFEDELDIEAMKKAGEYFVGEHYFRNFSKRNEKNSYREIVSFNMEKVGSNLVYTVVGKSFLWNMVRKMIGGLIKVGKHEIEPDCIKTLLEPNDLRKDIKIKPVSPYGLILSDIEYKGIKFHDSLYAKNKFIETLKEYYMINLQKKEMNQYIIDCLYEEEI